MTQTRQEDQEIPRLTSAVRWLLALNATVYFLQVAVFGAANMQEALGFRFAELPGSWWTVGTHMFVHGGFWHVALNMYVLFIFGPRVEHAWGTREFRNFFLWCALGGWLAHALLSRDSMFLGSTSGILGVALAYALRWADEKVHVVLTFPVGTGWLVSLLVMTILAVGMASGSEWGGVAYFGHAGGLVAGWLFVRTSAGPGIERLRERVSPVPDVPDETPRAIPRSLPRARERAREIDEIVVQSQQALSRQRGASTDHDTVAAPGTSSELDRVLDKISQSGIDSLTTAERKLLEERSRELRRGD